MSIPKVGDKIYIPSACFIGHGEDDMDGGLATISKVEINDCPNKVNRVFVSVQEIEAVSYNWSVLEEKQEELEQEYKGKMARPDPDYTDYGERW